MGEAPKDPDLPILVVAVARIYATDPQSANLAEVIFGQANVKHAIAQAWEENTSTLMGRWLVESSV
jgi:hypothetical protein